MQIPKYPLPSFLQGIFTLSRYNRWLKIKAQNLRNRDIRRKRPYPANNSVAVYRKKVHNAVMNNGRTDPYTGDAIDWTLTGEWDADKAVLSRRKPESCGEFNKGLYLAPSVDHVAPGSADLDLELCTWIVNSCKSELNPAEFIALCGKITVYCGKKANKSFYSDPKKYDLPPFLVGICTFEKYEHWLDVKAENIYRRDLALKRPYALAGSKSFYKEQIHKAVLDNGQTDPYTGDALDWTLIGKWGTGTTAARLAGGRLDKKFFLLPVADHTDPDGPILAFEICSWLVNECKGGQNPAEFLALCGKVTAHHAKHS